MKDSLQRIKDEAYHHGFYDAQVKERESQLEPAVYSVAQLHQPTSTIRVMPETLEKSKLFCALSGLDRMYYEYCMSVQIANRRSNKFQAYFSRLWDALCNRVIVALVEEPRYIWMEKVAREFAEAFRDCSLVADLYINTQDDIGKPRRLIFKALTWRLMK